MHKILHHLIIENWLNARALHDLSCVFVCVCVWYVHVSTPCNWGRSSGLCSGRCCGEWLRLRLTPAPIHASHAALARAGIRAGIRHA
jgi:hypothetical protein